MERGTGRTLQMVRHLPDGAVIIVHNRPLAGYVRCMIGDVRGVEFAKRCTVEIIGNRYDAEVKLTGLCRPVVFDHAWRDAVPSHVAAFAGELAAGVNGYIGMRKAAA